MEKCSETTTDIWFHRCDVCHGYWFDGAAESWQPVTDVSTETAARYVSTSKLSGLVRVRLVPR